MGITTQTPHRAQKIQQIVQKCTHVVRWVHFIVEFKHTFCAILARAMVKMIQHCTEWQKRAATKSSSTATSTFVAILMQWSDSRKQQRIRLEKLWRALAMRRATETRKGGYMGFLHIQLRAFHLYWVVSVGQHVLSKALKGYSILPSHVLGIITHWTGKWGSLCECYSLASISLFHIHTVGSFAHLLASHKSRRLYLFTLVLNVFEMKQ